MKLTISEIQIIPIKPNNGLIAFASFIVNESLFISSVAVYTRLNNPESYRLVYPSKLVGNNQTNILYPLKKEVGEYIENEVSRAVNNLFKKCDEYARYCNIKRGRNGL